MSEKLIIKCWTKGEARIWTAHTFTSNAYKDIETEAKSICKTIKEKVLIAEVKKAFIPKFAIEEIEQ